MIGLNLLYLAGGIVVVEYVFAFPGLGAGLVDAVSARDIPTIQFITLLLAARPFVERPHRLLCDDRPRCHILRTVTNQPQQVMRLGITIGQPVPQ